MCGRGREMEKVKNKHLVVLTEEGRTPPNAV